MAGLQVDLEAEGLCLLQGSGAEKASVTAGSLQCGEHFRQGTLVLASRMPIRSAPHQSCSPAGPTPRRQRGGRRHWPLRPAAPGCSPPPRRRPALSAPRCNSSDHGPACRPCMHTNNSVTPGRRTCKFSHLMLSMCEPALLMLCVVTLKGGGGGVPPPPAAGTVQHPAARNLCSSHLKTWCAMQREHGVGWGARLPQGVECLGVSAGGLDQPQGQLRCCCVGRAYWARTACAISLHKLPRGSRLLELSVTAVGPGVHSA